MSMEDPLLHLRLAGVTRLSLEGGRGPKDAFLFDPHRLALPSWGRALGDRKGSLLLTLDRHFDLVPPSAQSREALPTEGYTLRQLDEYARWTLDVRNYDHILAAMELGLVGDVIAIARGSPRGAFDRDTYTDRRGETHTLLRAPTIDRVADGFATTPAGTTSDVGALIAKAGAIILDVDLDCFTTLSDADPTEVVPWPRELIRRHLLPPGSEAFWDAVLAKCLVLTFAREPAHCGGVIAANRLFEDAAEVLFRELLRTDPP